MSKNNNSGVISFRPSKKDYIKKESECQDDLGNQLISVGQLAKMAFKSSKITVIDSKVEQYKSFILRKASNNLNQLAKQINIAAKAKSINDESALKLFLKLDELYEEITELASPIRERAKC
jgi:hypothetical protein